jgi:hypothetical protein
MRIPVGVEVESDLVHPEHFVGKHKEYPVGIVLYIKEN